MNGVLIALYMDWLSCMLNGRKEFSMDFIIYLLQGTLCMAAIAAGFTFICWLSTKIFKD